MQKFNRGKFLPLKISQSLRYTNCGSLYLPSSCNSHVVVYVHNNYFIVVNQFSGAVLIKCSLPKLKNLASDSSFFLSRFAPFTSSTCSSSFMSSVALVTCRRHSRSVCNQQQRLYTHICMPLIIFTSNSWFLSVTVWERDTTSSLAVLSSEVSWEHLQQYNLREC